MKLIAFDSGLERTGYALFEKEGTENSLGAYGCIVTSKYESLEKRLSDIACQCEALVIEHRPNLMVIEELFFHINKKTAIHVAQSQGVVIALAGDNGIPVSFLTPLVIKQTLTGYGRADKKQVEKMVMLLLKLKKTPKPDDVVDAIACGLAYCTIKKF